MNHWLETTQSPLPGHDRSGVRRDRQLHRTPPRDCLKTPEVAENHSLQTYRKRVFALLFGVLVAPDRRQRTARDTFRTVTLGTSVNKGKKGRGERPSPTIGARRHTLEGGFHEGLATSAYFRQASHANPNDAWDATQGLVVNQPP